MLRRWIMMMLLLRRLNRLKLWLRRESVSSKLLTITRVKLLLLRRLLPPGVLTHCRLISKVLILRWLIWRWNIRCAARSWLRLVDIQIQKFSCQFCIFISSLIWRSSLRCLTILQAVVNFSCLPFCVLSCLLNKKLRVYIKFSRTCNFSSRSSLVNKVTTSKSKPDV